MKKNTKRLLWIAGVLAVAVAGWAGYSAWKKKSAAKLSYITAPVERGDVRLTVTATGSLKAVTAVEVGTQVSGTVAALYADFNSRVKKGQVLARIDTTLLFASLQDARSNLERVSALNQQASEELKRMRSLFARELVSQAELDQAVASARVAAANLASARSGVERARINLRYAVITSPIDGIVLSRAVEIGQTVAASFSTPTLFSLAGDLKEMRVQAAVDEADIGRVKEGQTATFTVDAYPEDVFTGRVEQVRLQPTLTQNVVTYDVVLRVPNEDLRLMPGMTANLTITISAAENVLHVPSAALRFAPPGARRAGRAAGEGRMGALDAAQGDKAAGRVFVLEGGKPRAVRVATGLTDGSRTEVTGELREGMRVITGVESAEAPAKSGAPFGMQQQQRPRGAGGGGRR